MGKFPDPYSPATRATAVELLREAERSGLSRTRAAREVAQSFTNGPSSSTLLNWAKLEGLFTSRAQPVREPAPAGSKRPRYGEEFKQEVAAKVVELMNSGDGLSLRAAALKLVAEEPGMPSLHTLRQWVYANYEFTDAAPSSGDEPEPESVEEKHLDATAASSEVDDADERPAPTVPRSAGGLEHAASASGPLESADLITHYAELVRENARLRAANAQLAAAAQETAILRDLVRHYIDSAQPGPSTSGRIALPQLSATPGGA